MRYLLIVIGLCLGLTFPLFPQSTVDIERAFLQNNPELLLPHFPMNRYVLISFPEPIDFSDILTDQQAFLFFKKVFSSFTTFEFYTESLPGQPDGNYFIFKTRWSFRNRKNKNQNVFLVFFFLTKEPSSDKRGLPEWIITEIKAEKI
jgi:hypothetical protein